MTHNETSHDHSPATKSTWKDTVALFLACMYLIFPWILEIFIIPVVVVEAIKQIRASRRELHDLMNE